ncbi:gas vesicle protein GvpG [Streptomyces sp. NPDC050560]|uniref:gas vesicle protein GvpG n=1 Tax=Streptomyces sp. NPDC050560 TaxID=3365630 RepID=UPI0037A96439
MGLFTGLLLLPLAPVRGVGWIGERLLDVAERETCDPAVLRTRLAALNHAYEQGEISEEDFEREEEHLLDLLERGTPTAAAAYTAYTAYTASTTADTARGADEGHDDQEQRVRGASDEGKL